MAASFRFADYEITLASRELLRDGQRVQIRPKIWELLLFLARSADRPVSQDQLRQEVWRAQALSESSIPTAINELRNTLGKDAGLVETLPRTGYRLACPVQACFQMPPHRQPFVDRAPELQVLQSTLAAAASSNAQLVLISGDPGIGKTALVERFSERASRRGFAVLVGRNREDVGAPPFWPWTQVLRTWRGDESFDVAGSSADEEKEFAALNRTSPSAARFEIYRSISSSIREITQLTPLLLLMEDIHRADLPSLFALEFVLDDLRDARLMALATYRDAGISYDSRHADAIGALAQSAATRSLNLSGLRIQGVRRLISNTHPKEQVPKRFIDDLFARTRGNPLFLRKLLDLIPSPCSNWDRPLPVPRSLRDAIDAQLRSLPATCLEMLQRAATLGPEVRVAVLAEMSSETPETCLRTLEPAFRSRLVECVSPAVIRFAHGLLWEIVYGRVPAHARCQLHSSAGRALEAIHKSIPGSMAGELAHHFAEGLAPERAFTFSLAAAEWCGSRTAYAEAAVHLRSALAASTEMSNTASRVDLLIQLGEHELRAGNRGAGRGALIRAAREAGAAGDNEGIARAALALAPNVLSIEAGVVDLELIDLLEEALLALPPESSSLRARVMARLSIALVWTGETSRRSQLASDALSLSERAQDHLTRPEALLARHSLLCTPEARPERSSLISELAEITDAEALPESRLMAILLRITFLLEEGDLASLGREVRRFRTLAVKLRQPHFLWYLDLFSAMRSLLRGDFHDAGLSIRTLHDKGQRIQDANLWNCFGCHSAVQLWEFDQTIRALKIVSDFVTRFPRFDTWRAGKIFLETEANRLDEARPQYDLLTAGNLQNLIPNENWRMTLNFLARAAIRLEDREGARSLYDALAPGAGTMAQIGYAVVCWAPQDRELGVLASFLDQHEIARNHFLAATSLCEQLGARPLLAQTQADFANSLDATGVQEDRVLAETLRKRAHATAVQLGMKRLARLTST